MTEEEARRANEFARFMSMVRVGDQCSDCWEWLGNRPGGRYGHFSVGGATVQAHRWIYDRVVGTIPNGLMLRHRCDFAGCVNPLHLEPGTAKQNTQDMFDRNRNPDRRGEKHPLSRLDEPEVVEIRKLAACGASQRAIAERFGISRSHVGKIVQKLNWRHV